MIPIRRPHSRALILLAATLAAAGHRSASGQEVPAAPANIAVGAPAPAEIGDGVLIQGSTIPEAHREGKYLLTVYWSLGGPDEFAWLPELRKIRELYAHNRNLLISSICVNSGWEKWSAFLHSAEPLKENGRKIEIFRDSLWLQGYVKPEEWNLPPEIVDETRFPAAYLVDKNRRFLAVRIPMKDLVATMRKNIDPVQPAGDGAKP